MKIKPDGVKIIQIAVAHERTAGPNHAVFGLGDDGLPYRWYWGESVWRDLANSSSQEIPDPISATLSPKDEGQAVS